MQIHNGHMEKMLLLVRLSYCEAVEKLTPQHDGTFQINLTHQVAPMKFIGNTQYTQPQAQ